MTHAHHQHTRISYMGKRLGLALFITLAFVVIEVIAGVYANSLALLTDAVHNLTDVIALGLSWYAMVLTMKPSHSGKTYGYHRAGILIALFNSTTLVVIALGIFYEAYRRFTVPLHVEAHILIVAAIAAFFVNTATALMIKNGSQDDLNMRSAFVHLAGDALSTFGAIIAGIGIAISGIQCLDPLISVFIGGLILWNAWGIVRESVDILLEGTPSDIDIDHLIDDVLLVQGVRGIHDVHVWSITQKLRILSAHLLTEDIPISAGAAIQHQVSRIMKEKYGITHATLQLECVDCTAVTLYCKMSD